MPMSTRRGVKRKREQEEARARCLFDFTQEYFDGLWQYLTLNERLKTVAVNKHTAKEWLDTGVGRRVVASPTTPLVVHIGPEAEKAARFSARLEAVMRWLSPDGWDIIAYLGTRTLARLVRLVMGRVYTTVHDLWFSFRAGVCKRLWIRGTAKWVRSPGAVVTELVAGARVTIAWACLQDTQDTLETAVVCGCTLVCNSQQVAILQAPNLRRLELAELAHAFDRYYFQLGVTAPEAEIIRARPRPRQYTDFALHAQHTKLTCLDVAGVRTLFGVTPESTPGLRDLTADVRCIGRSFNRSPDVQTWCPSLQNLVLVLDSIPAMSDVVYGKACATRMPHGGMVHWKGQEGKDVSHVLTVTYPAGPRDSVESDDEPDWDWEWASVVQERESEDGDGDDDDYEGEGVASASDSSSSSSSAASGGGE